MHKNIGDDQTHSREAALADIGELAGPVIHEVNNLLNTLTLQLAVWQQSSPQAQSCDLQSIRQMISNVVHVLQDFQKRRLPAGIEPTLVDLNDVILRTVRIVQPLNPDVPITLEIDSSQLFVRGHPADVGRLCRYLLGNALRSVSSPGPPVTVRSKKADTQVIMEVEDSGPSVPTEALSSLFEPGSELRAGMCSLELAACMSIAHRLRGKVEAHVPPSGGLIITVRVPLAMAERQSNAPEAGRSTRISSSNIGV